MKLIAIPIEFRGRVSKNRRTADYGEIKKGEFVVGSLLVYEDGTTPQYWIRRQDKGFGIDYPVEPDSVKQMTAYDYKGAKVYAGDILVDKQGNEYVAQLRPCVVRKTPLGEDIHFDVDNFTLKEAAS